MQQQERRRVFRTGLSLENGEPIDLQGAILSRILHGMFLSLDMMFREHRAPCLASGCIAGEDKVGIFGLLVAGEAAFHKRRVGRFAICEGSETPAAGCGVFFESLTIN